MGVLDLNLYQHPSGVAFDPQKVIAKAKAWFPEASFDSTDQLAAQVRRAEEFFAKELAANPAGPAGKVVATLRRNARSYGPSYRFTVPVTEGGTIQGLARSVNVGFRFTQPLPDAVRERLIAFLTSLGVGRLASSREGSRTFETLADLRGPSDCLRDEPGVPWLKPPELATTEAG